MSYICKDQSYLIHLQRDDKYQQNYFAECMRQTSPNVLICPNSTELPIENDPNGLEDLGELNRELRRIRGNIKRQFERKLKKNKKRKTRG